MARLARWSLAFNGSVAVGCFVQAAFQSKVALIFAGEANLFFALLGLATILRGERA